MKNYYHGNNENNDRNHHNNHNNDDNGGNYHKGNGDQTIMKVQVKVKVHTFQYVFTV